MAESLTEGPLIGWVIRNLGGNIVCLEIEEINVKDAARLALEEYSKYKPLRVQQSYNVPVGSTAITPPVDVKGIELCTVIRITEEAVYGRTNTDAFMFSPFSGARTSHLPSTDVYTYELSMKWVDMTGRTLGSDPDWHYDYTTDTLHIWSPSVAAKAQVVWLQPFSYPSDLEKIPQYDIPWIRKFTTAHTKEVLGRVRSKYDSVPVAGTSLTLDGKDLIQEGKEEKETLLEELIGMTADLVPRWG